MEVDWLKCSVVESNPEKLGGTLVFKNTRLPISAIFNNLQDGYMIDDLLLMFPGVTREQIQSLLDYAAKSTERRVA